jgi:hypothetical protein
VSDEHPGRPLADAIGLGFQTLIEGLRDDVREDIREVKVELGKVEERVSARVAAVDVAQRDTRAYLESFANGHGVEHEKEAEERRATHGLFYDFIRKAELDAARRDGALGVARYSIELVSKHAGRIIAILTTLGLLGGLASGNISIGIGS